MVRPAVVLAALLAALLAAMPAYADSPKLVDARRAVESVDYEAARRLLLEALRDGDNSPAAVGEIYRLSARAAIVLGERDLAEQYYRRWLAIDAAAALPGDTAPKLREPFVAAQAYIAAHGRLVARADRTSTGEIDVELVADPLAMARGAAVLGTGRSTPVAFGGDHKAHLAAGSRIAIVDDAGSRVAIVDDAGNRLLELDVAPAPAGARAASESTSSGGQGDARPADAHVATPADVAADHADSRPWTRRWTTWAIPTGVFGVVTGAFGIVAVASYQQAGSITSRSGQYHLSDAEDNVRRGRTFTWITIAGGAVTLAFAIPTAIFYFQERGLSGTSLGATTGATLVPTVGNGHAGLAVAGRF